MKSVANNSSFRSIVFFFSEFRIHKCGLNWMRGKRIFLKSKLYKWFNFEFSNCENSMKFPVIKVVKFTNSIPFIYRKWILDVSWMQKCTSKSVRHCNNHSTHTFAIAFALRNIKYNWWNNNNIRARGIWMILHWIASGEIVNLKNEKKKKSYSFDGKFAYVKCDFNSFWCNIAISPVCNSFSA